jgi:hypothetical protein
MCLTGEGGGDAGSHSLCAHRVCEMIDEKKRAVCEVHRVSPGN